LAEQLAANPMYEGLKLRAKDWLNRPLWDAIKDVKAKLYYSVPQENGQVADKIPDAETGAWALSRRGVDICKVYCVSKYPPKLEELFLKSVAGYDGFSSHHPDWRVPLMAATIAVNYQATRNMKHRFYLEVHHKPFGIRPDLLPDDEVSLHKFSLENLCKSINMLEKAID